MLRYKVGAEDLHEEHSLYLRKLLKGQWTLLSMIESLQEPERNVSKSPLANRNT